MLTKPTALQLWNKIKLSPSAWFRSKDGKELTQKMIAMVRAKDGEQEALVFEGLCLAASLVG
jgi:lysophospholipid acyltransferase (LPLAT)-like uncharacterized protein